MVEDEYRLIIAGSRTVTDYATVREAVIASGFWHKYKKRIAVVSGRAKGVDRRGEEFAHNNGLTLYKFAVTSADWNTYGKRAGMLRNIKMGEFSHGLCAVWDGKSRGTKQMIDWATENGLDVYVHLVSIE